MVPMLVLSVVMLVSTKLIHMMVHFVIYSARDCIKFDND